MNDVEPTNYDRAGRCGEVLYHYGTEATARGCLLDFLVDARHWCDRSGESYAELDRKAYEHYLAERVENDGGPL